MDMEDVCVREPFGGLGTYLAGVEIGGIVLGEDFAFRHVGGRKLVLGEDGDRSAARRERRVF